MLVERVAALSPKKAGEMIDLETCRSGVTRALTPSQMLFPVLADGLHKACFRKFRELDEVEGGRKTAFGRYIKRLRGQGGLARKEPGGSSSPGRLAPCAFMRRGASSLYVLRRNMRVIPRT